MDTFYNKCWQLVVQWAWRVILVHRLEVTQDNQIRYHSAALSFPLPSGVLFSIEVTSTYYPLNTYASAFKCAIVGALVFRYFWFDTSYLPTNFDFGAWAYAEIPWFVILGVVEGLVGAIFIHCFAKVVERRRWFASLTNNVQSHAYKQVLVFCNQLISSPSLSSSSLLVTLTFHFPQPKNSPYVYGMMVALLTGLVTYPGNAKFISVSLIPPIIIVVVFIFMYCCINSCLACSPCKIYSIPVHWMTTI